jgi:hypothetical protein
MGNMMERCDTLLACTRPMCLVRLARCDINVRDIRQIERSVISAIVFRAMNSIQSPEMSWSPT